VVKYVVKLKVTSADFVYSAPLLIVILLDMGVGKEFTGLGEGVRVGIGGGVRVGVGEGVRVGVGEGVRVGVGEGVGEGVGVGYV